MENSEVSFALYGLMKSYEKLCQPICKEADITQTSYDILVFLSNNPDLNNASDICRMRGTKANLISFNIEKLVDKGYLERSPVPGDRRKVKLVCTEKAAAIVARGHEIHKRFYERVFTGFSEEERSSFNKYIDRIVANVNEINADTSAS